LVKRLDAHYAGFITEYEKQNILLNSFVVALPSYYGEGLPFVILEAQDAGCVVLTTNSPGCFDACSPLYHKFLTNVKEFDISDSLNQSLHFSKKISDSDLVNIKIWTLEKFSLEKVILEYKAIFKASGFLPGSFRGPNRLNENVNERIDACDLNN
jgi:glycosyltransferase involved in cell wall biosynthesis